MAANAADVRDFVAQQAADARVTAAVGGRREQPLAENAAEFLWLQAAAAASRRRSKSGRRAPPEPPDLDSVTEDAVLRPQSPPRAAMAAPQPQRADAEHAEGRSRGPQRWWERGGWGWEWCWEQGEWHKKAGPTERATWEWRGGDVALAGRDGKPWPTWEEVQNNERDEEIALGAAGPEARAQQEQAHAQEQRNWGASGSGSSSDGVGRTCTGRDHWNALTGTYTGTPRPTPCPMRMSIVPTPEMIQERARDRSPAADVTPQRGAAVAAPANPRDVNEPLTMGFFEQVQIKFHRRQHNAALKYIRDGAALADQDRVECDAVMKIGKILKQRRGKGHANMDYSWKDGETVDWSWHEMIAHMEPETRDLVVNGQEGSSGGLLRCWVSRRQNSYSHKMCYAANEGQQPPTPAAKAGEHQAEYDFVVERADGSAVRFHPDWCDKKFPIYSVNPHADPVSPPPQYGGTRGPGTYKGYKDLGKIKDGFFDAQRGSHMPPSARGYQ